MLCSLHSPRWSDPKDLSGFFGPGWMRSVCQREVVGFTSLRLVSLCVPCVLASWHKCICCAVKCRAISMRLIDRVQICVIMICGAVLAVINSSSVQQRMNMLLFLGILAWRQFICYIVNASLSHCYADKLQLRKPERERESTAQCGANKKCCST